MNGVHDIFKAMCYQLLRGNCAKRNLQNTVKPGAVQQASEYQTLVISGRYANPRAAYQMLYVSTGAPNVNLNFHCVNCVGCPLLFLP